MWHVSTFVHRAVLQEWAVTAHRKRHVILVVYRKFIRLKLTSNTP